MDPSAYEHGKYVIKDFKDKIKPECALCDYPECILCETKCDEFLYFECHCFGCHSDDYICKKCALTTALFTHLCKCFRQKTHHLWYNLKIVWEKIEGKYTFIYFMMSVHKNNISYQFLVNNKKCSICNLQDPIFYDKPYVVIECGCGVCGSISYTCTQCLETHKIQKCTENKICWLCKTVKCEFFREKKK